VLAGSLPEFPDLAWEDVERASDLAPHDVGVTSGSSLTLTESGGTWQLVTTVPHDAADGLAEAEETDGIVVSVATFTNPWCVTPTTEAATTDDLARLRATLEALSVVSLELITLDMVDVCTTMTQELLTDRGSAHRRHRLAMVISRHSVQRDPVGGTRPRPP
jgi:hypothetical protein